MANQSDEERWHYLDPEELRSELAAVWPAGVWVPKRAKVSADGRTWVYRGDEAKEAKNAS